MGIRNLFFTVILFNSHISAAIAQTTYDSSFHFYYYDQKLSFFKQMPVKKNVIVWMGDSITDGGEWNELFPNQHTLNRGISADNTFGLLNRISEVIKRKPRKIFILIGINDIARGIPDEVILRNYRRITDSFQLQTPSTKIYFQTILPANNDFTEFKDHQNKTDHVLFISRQIKKLCDEKKLVYVNLYDAFLDAKGKLDKRYTNDGLHLTGEGYLKWKELLTSGNYIN